MLRKVWSSGICGGQSGAGAGFLRLLRFPLPIFIPPNSPSSQSPGVGTIGQLLADVPSGPSLDSILHYENKEKDYNNKCLVEKNTGREFQEAWRQDELIGGKPPVVK
jgi:hypothetical protein